MRENLQLVMTETVAATISSNHALLQDRTKRFSIEELINIRQIVVASSEHEMTDSRSIIVQCTGKPIVYKQQLIWLKLTWLGKFSLYH